MATLVTGASAGLGEVFARQLAARGDALILTARRRERLEALAAELRERHGVAVDVIEADLAAADGPATLLVAITELGLHVDTLINNAGFGAKGAVADLPIEAQLGQIDVNCRALVALAHGVLPGMIAAKRGRILNLASTAAFQAGPYMAVYYATKAFVLSFSEALHEEVRAQGIHVTALCPGPTRTEFADVAGLNDSKLFGSVASDPSAVVRDGLAALEANRAIEISGAMNMLGAFGERFLPRAWTRKVAARFAQDR